MPKAQTMQDGTRVCKEFRRLDVPHTVATVICSNSMNLVIALLPTAYLNVSCFAHRLRVFPIPLSHCMVCYNVYRADFIIGSNRTACLQVG